MGKLPTEVCRDSWIGTRMSSSTSGRGWWWVGVWGLAHLTIAVGSPVLVGTYAARPLALGGGGGGRWGLDSGNGRGSSCGGEVWVGGATGATVLTIPLVEECAGWAAVLVRGRGVRSTTAR